MSSPKILSDLKEKLGNHLVPLDQLKTPEGLKTGNSTLDQFLIWGGLPKGELSLLHGPMGSGATSLWIQTIAELQKQKKWAAFVGSAGQLCPQALLQRKINLRQLLVAHPSSQEQRLWVTQELITSCLFDCIALQMNEEMLKHHQLVKLKNLARLHSVALVILFHDQGEQNRKSRQNQQLEFGRPTKYLKFVADSFSLILEFSGHEIKVQRASHRPTPFFIQKSETAMLSFLNAL